MSRVISGIIFLSILGTSLFAGDKELVSKLFTEKADKVVLIVKNKKLAKDTRNAEIVKTITPMFDFKLMAMLSLGKNVWRSLNDQKQDEFTALYVKRMKESYSEKIDKFTNEKIVIDKVMQPKADRIELVTSLVDEKQKTEVIYKLYKPKKQEQKTDPWLVYDVEIVGVSILKTDRSQFKEVLKTQTIEQLMEKLRG